MAEAGKKEEREARLADALRANLRRRKAKPRKRASETDADCAERSGDEAAKERKEDRGGNG